MTVTLEDLLDKLWFESKTTTEKGSAFEALIASFLRTAPESADRFEDVYLWNDWPERGSSGDHGIEIDAKDIPHRRLVRGPGEVLGPVSSRE